MAPTKGRESASAEARIFFDRLWSDGDHWNLEASPFERAKYQRQLDLVARGAPYDRILEIGCGAGVFTRLLTDTGRRVVGLDISEKAIERALSSADRPPHVEFRVANVMELDLAAEGAWDLIVMSETVYYLGWLYSFFDVAWLASQLLASSSSGGRLLMANSFGHNLGSLLSPALIETYRDLVSNTGFDVEHEEVFRGHQDNVPIDCLITLFRKPRAGDP